MKGRNTVVISIRIPDSVYTTLQDRAGAMSVGLYARQVLIASVHSVNTPVSPKLDGDGRIVPDYW